MNMVITLCGHAEASCPPIPPTITKMHWPIKDPVHTIGTEEQIMHAFKKARDEIKGKIENLIKEITGKPR